MNYKIIGGDQQEYGPATAEEMRQWIQEGRLGPNSMTQAEGDPEWRPLSAFGEFSDALREQAGQAALKALPPFTRSLFEVRPDISIASCLGRGWELFLSNFGVLFGATFLVWFIGMFLQFIPVIGILYWLIRGVLYGGLFMVFLRCIRQQPVGPGDAFSGFSSGFSQLMLVGVVSSLLTWLGFLFCLLPGIYLGIAWAFAIPLVADKNLEFWSAMELSRKMVGRVWFKIFALVLVAFLPYILISLYVEVQTSLAMRDALKDLLVPGQMLDFAKLFEAMSRAAKEIATTVFPWILGSKIVLLLNMPFALGALMYAYEDIFGPGPRSR